MVPNAKVYTCMIEHLCCTNQLDAAFGRLVEMQARTRLLGS
jgi:pentatricopeptide repeat protein